MAGLEKIIFARIFDAVQELPHRGAVGINGPDMIQVLKTLVDQGFFHGPGKGVQVLGAVLAEDLLLKIEIGMAHFARRRIEETDEGFSVVAEHGQYSIIKKRERGTGNVECFR